MAFGVTGPNSLQIEAHHSSFRVFLLVARVILVVVETRYLETHRSINEHPDRALFFLCTVSQLGWPATK